jgi:hypothetical protein
LDDWHGEFSRADPEFHPSNVGWDHLSIQTVEVCDSEMGRQLQSLSLN